ncbi:MAG: hypothetical protein WBH36_07655, partial [Syntrophobacteria bacterium]
IYADNICASDKWVANNRFIERHFLASCPRALVDNFLSIALCIQLVPNRKHHSFLFLDGGE